MTFTPIRSSAVTWVPLANVRFLVVPFNVKVTGRVVVVPVGILSSMNIVI